MNSSKLIKCMLMVLLLIPKLSIAQQKPNVLWILTDDQRYDAIRAFNKMLHGREMSELGYVESPQVDKLTKMGTTFINTYCQAQGCAPSRASMHYGRYPFRSGIYEFEYHNNNTSNSYPHLPEQMAKLGYQTVHIGKLGLRLRTLVNGKAVTPKIYQTDIDSRTLSDEGFSAWGKVNVSEIEGEKLDKTYNNIKFLRSEDKTYYISEELEKNNPQFAGMAQEAYDKFELMRKHTRTSKETVFSSGILAGESPRGFGKTRDGYYSSVFIDFLNHEDQEFEVGKTHFKGINTNKPLFCHIGFNFPHTPVLPPKEYRKRFQKHSYKVPELTDEEWASMPKQLQKQVNTSRSNEFSKAQKQKMVQDYYAFCSYGDSLVGQAADAFIRYSETKKQPWMIVYVCGDHGWKLNEHGAYSKFTPWEIDSHNPIIVVSSDKKTFPAGKVVEDYSEFVDIAPTILSAAGADVQTPAFGYLDGMDLARVAKGKAPKRDYVIGESHAVIGPRAFIRTRDFVFSMQTRPDKKRGENMEWALKATYSDLDPALYHTPSDPHETKNLAFDAAYHDVAMRMKEKLINIVLGDNRAEILWGGDNYGTKPQAIGTEVHYSNFAPGAHDYKLHLPYPFDPKISEEFRMRGGLPNFFAKVNTQDTIKVGYVGGSITAGPNEWSEKTFDWIKSRYPQSHFEMLNIAVPGTGVDFGALRIGDELLKKNPDLVFIEYRVNGLGGQGLKGVEGMIRNIYRSNPHTDVCMVFTISEGMIEHIRNGRQTSVGEVMETAANYYGIPSIDMGPELVKLLDEGKLIFKAQHPVEGKIVFTKDGTHPGEAGAEIYKNVVVRNLLKMESFKSASLHHLPQAIEADNFEYPSIHTIDELTKNNAKWIPVNHDTDPIFKTGKWRSAFVLNKTIKCNTLGESIALDWEGFGLCLSTIPQGDHIAIEISSDGERPKEYVLKQKTVGNYGSVMLYLPFLSSGKHHTTITLTKLPHNGYFYFGQFYTVAKAVDSSVAHTANIEYKVKDKRTSSSTETVPSHTAFPICHLHEQQVLKDNFTSQEVEPISLGEGLYFIQPEKILTKFIKA